MRFIITLLLLALAGQGQPPPGSPAAAECADYPKNLESCTAYTCTFHHPFTGAPMQRKIVGLQGDTCAYVEEMPNGGSMECSFTPASRQAMAAFVRATTAAQSVQTSARMGSDGSTASSTSLDGRPVANPLNDALRSGACVVKGYGTASRPAAPSGRASGAASSAPAPAPAPAAAARPAMPAVGTAVGTLTIAGKAAPLTHVYALPQPDRLDRTKEAVLIVLTSAAVTPAQAADPRELQRMMRANQLHAVSVVLRELKTVDSAQLYDAGFGFSTAVSIGASTIRFEPDTADGTAMSGRLSTLRPGTNSGVSFEFSLTFNAQVRRAGATVP